MLNVIGSRCNGFQDAIEAKISAPVTTILMEGGMDVREDFASASKEGAERSPVVVAAEIILFILGLVAAVFVVFILWLATQA
jgi:hypothetical protein